eukprot:gnl/MRDRNA2_/MRDRNA2_96021_c0_seq1.p1 gnl/MRDRNA2_/MRDRNA2_96021_c0~~gnl/MRDRNA2_/MRDRNA2_96021_c0_seq1.p1  ORF type:complete len:169 (+),score=25.82 gnl/MRDRNA2_/MRDRNA2_96021_c0_seq1:111-617(+)
MVTPMHTDHPEGEEGFKVVAKVGWRYFSVWAGEKNEYALRMQTSEPAQARHRGGIYFFRTLEAAVQFKIPPHRGGLAVAPRVVLRCFCEGPFVEYPGGKVACSKLIPVEEIPLPEGRLHLRPASSPHLPGQAARSRGPSMSLRRETESLEAEVLEMERRLGYIIAAAS